MGIMRWIIGWTWGEDPHRREREKLRLAGLRERKLRSMAPDDRVLALEGANLDPYDYIYLAY